MCFSSWPASRYVYVRLSGHIFAASFFNVGSVRQNSVQAAPRYAAFTPAWTRVENGRELRFNPNQVNGACRVSNDRVEVRRIAELGTINGQLLLEGDARFRLWQATGFDDDRWTPTPILEDVAAERRGRM